MRVFIYNSLTEHLLNWTDEENNPIIKHIDLWNEQVEFIEQETPFDTPAIFIEFLEMKWVTLGGNAQKSNPTIRFHIVQKYEGSCSNISIFREKALERFTILDELDKHMASFMQKEGDKIISLWQRSTSSTNHNHDELIEDITDYTCTLYDKLE